MSKLILLGGGSSGAGEVLLPQVSYDFSVECPAGFTGGAVCWNNCLCVRDGNNNAIGPEYTLPGGPYTSMHMEMYWYSSKPSGWGVGHFRPQYWNGSGWSYIYGPDIWLTSHGASFATTTWDYGVSVAAGAKIRAYFYMQGAQWDQTPYPVNCRTLLVSFS
jgi:hypothetical protein